jgi:predicted N-acetyltransferase YhbS
MNFIIRPGSENDYEEVEFLTREAFWDICKPGCDEHLLSRKLRKVPGFIKELDFVAFANSRIVIGRRDSPGLRDVSVLNLFWRREAWT